MLTLVLLFAHFSGHGSVTYVVNPGEELEVAVFTRSPSGAKFTLTDAKHNRAPWVENFILKHHGQGDPSEIPSHAVVNKEMIKGPANVKVKADSLAGRFNTQNFLVVFSVYRSN